MITEIKTKDLLKLFDPIKDTININNSTINLDLVKLDNLVSTPNNELFNNTEDLTDNFYKNLALYIINFDEDSKYINVNLEKEQPNQIIESGLEHLIALQYLKKPTVFINIEENNTGLQFIKTKKLSVTEKSIPPYKPTSHLKDINFEDQIVVENFFAWAHGEKDIEKDKSFYLKSLIDCVSLTHRKDNSERNLEIKKITDIFQQIPLEISQEPKFIEDIFKHEQLSTVFFELFGNGQKFVDFSSDQIKSLIFKDIEEGNMKWVKTIYSENKSYRSQQISERISYTNEMYNHPNVVKALTDGTIKSYGGWSSSEFNIRNVYSLLNKEHQVKNEVIFSYIEACEADHRGSEKWITDSELFKIPLECFKDLTVLKRVAYTTDFQNFKQRLLKEEFDFKLDKSFILDVAKNLSTHRFRGLIEGFFKNDATKFDDEFKKECLRKNPRLYEDKIFNSMFKKIDFLIFLKEELHMKSDKISFSSVRPFLFDENLTEKQQAFLYSYMVESKKNLSKPSDLDIPKEFHEQYRDKYQKLEHCFYIVDTWSAWRDDSIKRLKKVKSEEEIINIFSNASKYGYEIDAKSFFAGINPDLKNNSKVIFSFLENIGTNVDLRECGNFLFNKQNCIKLLDYGVALRKFIPEPMYYDKNFSLALAEKLDKNPNFENIPVKVKKFFEQKEVNQNYHTFLKSFISYNELVKTVDNEKPIVEIKKKMKI